MNEVEKENVVIRIEKYDEMVENRTRWQILSSLLIGAEGMYVAWGLLHEGTISSVDIATKLVAMGLTGVLFIGSMLEKIIISNERKNFIQSQLKGMEIEANTEGKCR